MTWHAKSGCGVESGISVQYANAAGCSKGIYLSAQFQQLRGRRGHAKERKAVEHSIVAALPRALPPRPLPRPRC
ncbi:MAG: hypothetical protein ACRDTK_01055 [Mycobacterium sp.]